MCRNSGIIWDSIVLGTMGGFRLHGVQTAYRSGLLEQGTPLFIYHCYYPTEGYTLGVPEKDTVGDQPKGSATVYSSTARGARQGLHKQQLAGTLHISVYQHCTIQYYYVSYCRV